MQTSGKCAITSKTAYCECRIKLSGDIGGVAGYMGVSGEVTGHGVTKHGPVPGESPLLHSPVPAQLAVSLASTLATLHHGEYGDTPAQYDHFAAVTMFISLPPYKY